MSLKRILKPVIRWSVILLVLYCAFVVFFYCIQRSLLYFPSHEQAKSRLEPWIVDGETIGFCRKVADSKTVWLMMHGNAGQASSRDYVLSRISDQDSLYVLEYPGYGDRAGKPNLKSMNQAAVEAYQQLREQNPGTPVCVLGESIGSGPACVLANESNPPDKIVLVVPFDKLSRVGSTHFYFLPVGLLLSDNWDNINALRDYAGPVVIYGAADDRVIPFEHAKRLAENISDAELIKISGGHNDWSAKQEVKISN